MDTLRLILAFFGIVAVVVFLVMKKETKTVLISVGLISCLLCLKPMNAFGAFTEYMTKAGLIKAIRASMVWHFKYFYIKPFSPNLLKQ